ncbi:NADH dehydrogenase [ubiquinone] 1 alpha subcomplex assembly factor 3 [Pseudocohnilembus persalinus]|uniref:NADH dehydrogenase [ubiquinone] 1 alpha subcomplex assembly factor 3 n=1 Tax=Pseudocohnilembus persalinus TaxID=266149 RepID=A0A0V0QXQ2_PSEPJ|nr:NADH dehydrogenase [ubiquinone] 1 alpha subcomplex assembly factor 3 [Pseudocohnilembus persalinus]|eukprot:KRX07155.1 NADH dehydrogenase [ubiquinone] 1 alpha subcomplex assembly factor 3 [Pseudocohnilembus persalinus]
MKNIFNPSKNIFKNLNSNFCGGKLIQFKFSSGINDNNSNSNSQNENINQKSNEGDIKQHQDKNPQYANIKDEQMKIQLREKAQQLKVRSYEIENKGDYYNIKNQKNPTQGVFDFSEDILAKKSYIVQVFGLGNGYFSVNDIWYPGSICVFPRQIFLWDINQATEIKPHSLDILDVIKPTPNYIIIGTGKEKYDLNEDVYKRFTDRKIRVDVLPTFEACSTFNVCAEDGMNVCAFILPANL